MVVSEHTGMKLLGPQANVAFGRNIGDERAAHPLLRRHFSKAWHLDIPPQERPLELLVIPDGCAELIWLDETFHVISPNYRAARVLFHAGSKVFGFRFGLGVAPSWLGVHAIDLAGDLMPLEDLNPRLNAKLHEGLGDVHKSPVDLCRLESALLEVSKQRPSVNACMTRIAETLAVATFAPGQLLTELQELTNLSERSVRRETERFMGFGPKRLERVARFQRFLVLKWNQEYDDLASLAVAAGYADQSHLTREARALTGLTPKQLSGLCYEQPPIEAKNRPDLALLTGDATHVREWRSRVS